MSGRSKPSVEAANGQAPIAWTELCEFWRAFHAVARTAAQILENAEKMQACPVRTGYGAYGKRGKHGMTSHGTTVGAMPLVLIVGARTGRRRRGLWLICRHYRC